MVAIVSGNSLGLSLTSQVSGQNTTADSAALGRNGLHVYVNSATGNLVLQNQDDYLAGTGMDAFALRTYNSQGGFDGDNNDLWRIGFYRGVHGLKGSINGGGSSIVYTGADGAQSIYTFNGTHYINGEGEGAHDILTFNGTTQMWYRTDGDTRAVESFDWTSGAGKLVRHTDAGGRGTDFIYSKNLLSEVRSASGEKQVLIYEGNNLTELRTVKADTSTLTRVRYGYDTLGRLGTVSVDLSPDDNSIADGKTYVTRYSYDGDSKRVAGIVESDGTQAAFTYKTIGSAWLLETMSQVVDGVTRTTTFGYGDILNAVPTAVNVNNAQLDTIGDQVIHMSPAVDSSKFTTSEVITVNNSASVDTGKLVTNDSYLQSMTGVLETGRLSTLDEVPVPRVARLNQQAVSTTDPLLQDHVKSLDSGKLSLTEVQGGYSHASIDPSRLISTESDREARSAALVGGALSTSDTIVTPGSAPLNTGALTRTGTSTLQHDVALNTGALSTAGTRTDAHTIAIDAGKLSTISTGIVAQESALDTSKLNTTRGETVPATANLDAAALSTTEVMYSAPISASLITSKLSTQETSLVSYSAALKTTYLKTTESVTRTIEAPRNAAALMYDTVMTPMTVQRLPGVTSYTVPSGAATSPSWEDAALACYGDRRAGPAMASALGGNSLMPGTTFTNLPPELTFSVASPGASYYKVVYLDNWGKIAMAVYGTNEANAITALKTALGNPTLAMGMKLYNMPSPLRFARTTIEATPQHYLVLGTDTWAGICSKLYGTTDAAAVTALQDALGRPTLAANLKLTNLPAPLQYSKNVTVTVAAHYRIKAGDTWATIANTLYATTAPEAATALQTALGNPALVAGGKLTALPAKISYRTSNVATVPPHYRIVVGDTWASIAQKLYGTAEAGDALAERFGYQPLTAGTKLMGMPPVLSFDAWVEVPVAPYYLVTETDTYASLALSLYGASAAEAAEALRTALGVELRAKMELTDLPPVLQYSVVADVTVPAYYTVAEADTWSSLAETLYGSVLPGAGEALRSAMGSPVLAGGLKLTGLPDSLSFSSTVDITVPPYYTVQAGDSWASLADALYGDAGAADALASAMGGVPLATGLKLDSLPAALSYQTTVVVAVPAHYVVMAGDSWESITQALHGTSTAAAVAALRLAMGAPLLAAGLKLESLPERLAYETTADVTVPAYYRVARGDTWTSIAAAVYGVTDPAAGAALQAAMGNPVLAEGARLTSFDAILDYQAITGTRDVPPYYLIQNDDTWSSITQHLFGTSDPDAADALQEAMGKPTLLEGAKLTNIPAELTYQVHVPAAPHYRIKSGDTWSSVAQTLYGSALPEAAAALQLAANGQPLTVGAKLVDLPSQLSFTTTTVDVPAYYRIAEGDTWTSIALALYGTDDAAAASALRAAMGNPLLTAGEKLVGPPQRLDYTLPGTTVPPYYRVHAGDTWASIAGTLYYSSSEEGAAALRLALGNPDLVAGARLTGLPPSLTYNVRVPIAPYYTAKAGETWESMTEALYRTRDAEAVTALKTQIMYYNAGMAEGTRFTRLPDTLSYTTRVTVLLDSTYVVQAGDNWAGITLALYGTSEAAAVAALRHALGNPELAVGAKLSGVPASLHFVVTATGVPVAPYYRVKAGDTWDSITAALYGTSNEGAVAALRAALGDPELSAGGQLANLPGTLNYAHASPLGPETRVTDGLGNVTILKTDNRGRLVKMTGPQVDGASASVNYTYDAQGNLLTQTDSLGNTSSYGYDERGNQVVAYDRMGNRIGREYNELNQRVSESVRFTPGNSSYGPSDQTTRFTYGSGNLLRFAVSQTGQVTEYRYDADGNQTALIKYTAHTYAGAFATNDLANWVGSLADKSTIERTDFTYDFRGQVSTATVWSKVGGDGVGVADGSQQVSRMVYDQAGRLLQTIASSGLVTTRTYDGLGRTLTLSDNAGTASTMLYDDAGQRVITTLASGLMTTSVYNSAGELTSVLSSDASGSLGQTRYWYDANGRLAVTQAPDGAKQISLYDDAGRKVADISGAGRVSEYRYNANGLRTQTVTYATHADLPLMARSVDLSAPGREALLEGALALALDAIRPAASAQDGKEWNLYDAADRLVWQIDALGYATQSVYDVASNVYVTNRLAAPLDLALLNDGADLMVLLQGNATNVKLTESSAAQGANGARTFVAVVGSTAGAEQPTGSVSFFAGAQLLGSAALSGGVAMFTAANLPAGHVDITAVYSGNGVSAGSTSRVLGMEVAAAQASTVSLSLPQTTAVHGSALVLSAAVTAAQDGGMVAFYSGATAIGFAAVANGVALLSLSSLPVGVHSLRAEFLGNATCASSMSGSVQATVTLAPTTVQLSSSDTSTNVGTEITLTARITGGRATGTVTFYDQSGEVLGTGRIVDNVASAVVRNQGAGMHHIVAAYSGDAVHAGSVSSPIAEQVDLAVTHTMLYGSTDTSGKLPLLTLTAYIDGFNPNGQVSFYGPANELLGTASVTHGVASITLVNPGFDAAGVKASYAGDANNAASTSVTVGRPSALGYFSGSAESYTLMGTDKWVYATVHGGAGIVRVFDPSGKELASASVTSGAQAQIMLPALSLPGGVNLLTLVFSGNGNLAPMVTTVSLNLYERIPAMSVSASASGITLGQSTVLTAVMAPAAGGIPLAGRVVFTDWTSGAVLGSAAVIDGRAAFRYEPDVTGPKTIRATYADDPYHAENAVGINLVTYPTPAARPVVALTSSTGTAQQGERITFSASLSAAGRSLASLQNAKVYFYNGHELLGSAVTDASGSATLETSITAVGTATIKAVAALQHSTSMGYEYGEEGVSDALLQHIVEAASPIAPVADTRPPATTQLSFLPDTVGQGLPISVTDSVTLMAYVPEAAYGDSVVSFYNNGELIGVAHGTRGGRLILGRLPVGEHAITAVASPIMGYKPAVSAVHTVRVERAATGTELLVNPVRGGARHEYSLTARVQGALVATGKVRFYMGDTLLGAVTAVDGIARLTAPLTGGAVSVRAEYEGDAANKASNSAAVALTVFNAGTQVTLTSSRDTAAVGEALTLSARVSGLDANGSVTFFDGERLLGSANLIGDTASLTVSSLAPGARALRAVYNADARNGGAVSAIVAATIEPSTALTLIVDRTDVVGSAPVSMTAVIGGGATGTVDFLDGTTVIGSATLVDGKAQFTFARLVSGEHALRAVYAGDGVHAAQTSAPVRVDAMAAPSFTVQPLTSSSTYGEPVVLSATVQGNAPAGVVTFYANVAYLDASHFYGTAKVVDGVATLVLDKGLPPGAYGVRASYSGDGINARSISEPSTHTVAQSASTLSLSAQHSVVAAGTPLLLQVSVNPKGGLMQGGRVNFYEGATLVGYGDIGVDGVATLMTTSLAKGVHSIRAVFAGNSLLQASEATVSVEVTGELKRATTVSMTPTGGWNYVSPEQTIQLRATVAGGDNAGGMLTFVARGSSPSTGYRVLGAAPVVNGVATIDIQGSAFYGDYQYVSASYSGDEVHAGADTGVSYYVYTSWSNVPADVRPATALTFSQTLVKTPNAPYCQLVATLGDPSASGSVTFFSGDAVLGSATVVGGQVTFDLPLSAIRSLSVKAIYSGDAAHARATSTFALNIEPIPAAVTVFCPPTPYVIGSDYMIGVRVDGAFRTGQVELYANGRHIGQTSITNGYGYFSKAASTLTEAGTYAFEAVFTSANGVASGRTTVPTMHTAVKPTSTKIVATPAYPNLGAEITLQAHVQGAQPGGTVMFFDSGPTGLLGTAEVKDGVATLVTRRGSMATAYWRALYSGDSRNGRSDDTTSYNWNNGSYARATPVTTASDMVSKIIETPQGPAQEVTVTVTGAKPGGHVSFFSASGELLGTTVLSETDLPSQSRTVFTFANYSAERSVAQVTYSGDASNASSVSARPAVPAPAARISVSSSDSLPNQGLPFTLTATLAGEQPGGELVFLAADGRQLGRVRAVDGVATLAVSSLPAGKNAITVMYLGDAKNGFVSQTFVQEVARSRTSVALRMAGGTHTQGMQLTIGATVVRPGIDHPLGTVTFYSGATIIGQAELTNGYASISVTGLAAGDQAISVRYSGDANNVESRTEPVALTVAAAPAPSTMTLVTSRPGEAVAPGTKMLITARIAGTTGKPATGLVTFFYGNEVLGTASVSDGVATLDATMNRSGYDYIRAAYAGDEGNASTTGVSSGWTYVTGNAPPSAPAVTPSSLTFVISPTGVTVGQAATLKATISVVDAAHPAAGAVTFFDQYGMIGSAPVVNGVASFAFAGFRADWHGVKAVYSGDQYNAPTRFDNAASAGLSVGPITLTPVLSAARDSHESARYLRLSASVEYPNGNAAAILDGQQSVEFFMGTASLGRATLYNGQAVLARIDTDNYGPGPLRAVLVPWQYHTMAKGESAPVTLDTAAQEPVKLFLTASPQNGSLAGGSLVLDVRPDIPYWKTWNSLPGVYSFFDGDELLGSVETQYASSARFTVTNIAAGTHQYRAVFSGRADARIAPSYSGVVTHTATMPATGIDMVETPVDAAGNEVSWGNSALKYFRTAITVYGNPTPTGSVVLYNAHRGERLGTVTLENGKASFLVPSNMLMNGARAWSIQYTGDEYNAPASTGTFYRYGSGVNLAEPWNARVSLSSRPDPLSQPGFVELYAKVSGTDPGGSVVFKDAEGNVLGQSAIIAGMASLRLRTPPEGLSGVKAVYVGDALNNTYTANYTAPAATLPATTTTLSTNAGTVALGASVTLTARVSGAANPGGAVMFYDGTTLLGTAALQSGAAVITVKMTSAGAAHLTAVYTGDGANGASMSGAIDEMVMGAPVTVVLSAPAGPVRQGAAVTYTAKVSGNMAGGQVTFISGKTVLGTATVVNGNATLSIARNTFDAGLATIVASYAGDGGHAPAISAAVEQTVTAGVKQIVVGKAADDRQLRRFFDMEGRLRATVDSLMGYTEYTYDSANRLTRVTRSAQVFNSAAFAYVDGQSQGNMFSWITSYRPAAHASDQHTYLFYDNSGRKIAEVNPEGYLSENVYDGAGRVVETIRYANPAAGAVTTASKLSAMRPLAHAEDQRTFNGWDLRNRLVSQTAADGTVTTFTYDSNDQLTSSTRAHGTLEARTTFKRYDSLGRLAAELSAAGGALIVGEQTAEQVDAIWAAHGTRHAYDVGGHRIATTDALGQRTVFFHDADGQLRFTVNGEGNVTENEYDGQGRLVAVTRYAGRIAVDQLAFLAGGALDVDSNSSAVAALAAARAALAANNSRTTTAYDALGQVVQVKDALAASLTKAYNGFGEVTSEIQTGSGSDITTLRQYDRVGQETATVTSAGTVYIKQRSQYDLFGRMVSTTDVVGNLRQIAYDRLGRVVQTIDPVTGTQNATYDAFDRQLTTTDTLRNVTRYSYDTAARSMTVTTAENISTTTVKTRTGEMHSISDGNLNITSYRYDLNGNLLDVTTPGGVTESRYDNANRLIRTIDGEGRAVAYEYDRANRVLKRTVDPEGLALTTTYAYDGKGQAVSVTNAAQVTTVTEYDLNGAVLKQTVDPTGANLTTTYTYDAAGKVLSVVEAGGLRTEHVYDDFGRRVQTTVDPDGLKLVQKFTYDVRGNVISSTDANGNLTRYSYNSAGLLQYQVDPMGYVTHMRYDAAGQVLSTTVYNTPVSGGGMPSFGSSGYTNAQPALDNVNYHVYDKDGRVTFDVDGLGGVTAYTFDGAGNVTVRRTFANRINMGTWVVGTAPSPVADAARDVVMRTVYDGMNRPAFTIDGTGAVSKMVYDESGKLVDMLAYASRIDASTEGSVAAVSAALAGVANAGQDGHVRYTYDSAGRKLWETSSIGQVTGHTYDKAGNVVRTVVYASLIAPGAQPNTVPASSADRVTLFGHDVLGRVVVQIDHAGLVTRQSYDNNGNVVATVRHADAVAIPVASSTIALADGVVADATRDQLVRSVFDRANREIFRIDGAGLVIAQQFNANGQVLARTAYATPIDPAKAATKEAIEAAVAAIADATRDVRTRYVYDADGMLIWSVENGRDLSAYSYNSLGEMVRRTLYAKALAADQTDFGAAAMSAAATAASNALHDRVSLQIFDKDDQLIWNVDSTGAVTKYTYDVAGQRIASVTYAARIAPGSVTPGATPSVTNSVNDVRSFSVYDSAGRLSASIDGSGGVTRFTYDGKGQVVEQITYAKQIDMATWVAGTDPVTTASAADSVLRTVYDAGGRTVFTIDHAGRTQRLMYGADGKVSDRITYASTIPAATPATEAAVLAALAPDAARDLHERYQYDHAGRVRLQADSGGRVKGFEYDDLGRVVKAIDYAVSLAPGASLAAVGSSADRVVLMAYDIHGRMTHQIDAFGQISQRDYDARGNVIRSVTYANRTARPTTASAIVDAAAVAALVSADSARDQVSVSVFDADDQEIYSVDARGAVVARQFDAVGNVISRTAYFTTVTVPLNPTAASMAALVAGIADPARDDTVRNLYDQQGRVRWTVNAAGDATSTAYTVTGQVATEHTYLGRVGAAVSMTDAAIGAALAGVSPSARYSYVYDGANRLAYTVDHANMVTSYRYDGAGREVQRTVHANRLSYSTALAAVAQELVPSAAKDDSLRTVYDGAGRAVFTIDRNGFVAATRYDVQGNVVERVAYATPIDPLTAATVAAVEGAIVANPALDARSAAVYDRQNRVTFALDQSGFVTGYTYDVDGNVVKQVAYATPLAAGAAPDSVSAAAGDRVSLTAFDAQGRALVSVDPVGRVTTVVYDSYGNVAERKTFANLVATPVAGSVLIDASFTLPAADSKNDRSVRAVYDGLGREIYRLNQAGAVTATRYSGMNVERISYAAAIPVGTALTAQAMGDAVLAIADSTRDHVARETYNGAGQLVATTNARNGVTRFSYDEQGRQIQQVSPEGHVSRSYYNVAGQLSYTVSANGGVTGFTYDASGNLVKQVKFTNILLTATNPSLMSPSTNDGVSLMAYDQAGRLVYAVDGAGSVRHQQFDAAGNVTALTVYSKPVDVAALTAGAYGVAAIAAMVTPQAGLDRVTRQVFDAANRLAYSVDSLGFTTSFEYDAAGNATRKTLFATSLFAGMPGFSDFTVNGISARLGAGSAADRVEQFGYNILGQVTWHRDLDGKTESTQFDNIGNRIGFTDKSNRTWTFDFDNAGNQIKETGPQLTGISGELYKRVIVFTYDALGQVTSRTETGDGDHAVTDRALYMVYDASGREIFRLDQAGAVSETRYDGLSVERLAYAKPIAMSTALTAAAMAQAVAAVADTARDRFVRETYDGAGLLITSTDARNGITRFGYDGQGRKLITASPEGDVARQYFDAAGQLSFTVTPTGSVTGYTYDAFGNMVKQVQYSTPIAASATPSSTSLQSTDRVSLMAYDTAGRLVYAVDGTGAVRHQQFDAAGNLTALTLYATRIDVAATAGSIAGFGVDAIKGLVTPAADLDRVNRQIFDAANRMIYSVDAQGFATKYKYDVAGNLTLKTAFEESIVERTPSFGDFSVVGLDGHVVVNAELDRTEEFRHNILGQVIWSKDAEGHTEDTVYDYLGQKVGFTDKARNVWSYQYDKAGNQTLETAPAVPGKVAGTYQRTVAMEYDALGQLKLRTESGDGETTINTFEYDNLGNQITISFGRLTGYVPGQTAPQQSDTVSVSKQYNRQGQLLKLTDADGFISNKVYDADGRLRYEVDSKGEVTGYALNAFGEVISLTRYDGAITFNQASPPNA